MVSRSRGIHEGGCPGAPVPPHWYVRLALLRGRYIGSRSPPPAYTSLRSEGAVSRHPLASPPRWYVSSVLLWGRYIGSRSPLKLQATGLIKNPQEAAALFLAGRTFSHALCVPSSVWCQCNASFTKIGNLSCQGETSDRKIVRWLNPYGTSFSCRFVLPTTCFVLLLNIFYVLFIDNTLQLYLLVCMVCFTIIGYLS